MTGNIALERISDDRYGIYTPRGVLMQWVSPMD